MTTDAPTRIIALHVGDSAAEWTAAGFEVEGDHIRIGDLVVVLHGAGAGRGILGWSLDPATADPVDGLPGIPLADVLRTDGPAAHHPNQVIAADHVVLATPDLERTTEAFGVQGWQARRTMRQDDLARTLRFFLAPVGYGSTSVVLEVMCPDDPPPIDKPAKFWGLALTSDDLDAAAEALGPGRVSRPKPAIQPGRRIATIRAEATGTSVPLALLSPRP